MTAALCLAGGDSVAHAQFGGTGGGRTGGVSGTSGFGGTGISGGGFGNTGFGNTGFNTAGTGQSQGFTANLNGNNVFGPTQANPFRNYYLNPNSLGNRPISGSTGTLANRTAQGSFGQPVFPVTATSAASGGFGTAGGGIGGTTGTGLTGGGRGTTTGGLTGGGRGTTTGGFGGTTTAGGRTGGTFGGTTTGRTGGLGGTATGRGTTGFGTTGVGGTGGTSGLGTGIGGTAGMTGIGGFSGGGSGGFATPSQRSTGYFARLSPILQPRVSPPSQLRTRVQSALQSSSFAPMASNISVDASGSGELILRGTVSSAREARKIEAYVRLTPGVRVIRNELKVAK